MANVMVAKQEITCPTCGIVISPEKPPQDHLRIVENTIVGYPYFPNLQARCTFIGKEIREDGRWAISSVWQFEWHDEKDQHDVAAVGVLSTTKDGWSWAMLRCDDGLVNQGGEKLNLKVFDKEFPEIFNRPEALKGYIVLTGSIG